MLSLILVSVTMATYAVATSVPMSECVYNNETVPEGPIDTGDPCSPCECYNGEVSCSLEYCLLSCVDSVQEEGKCCPSCPDGYNCQAPNGTVIPAGKVVEVNGEQCTCLRPEPNMSIPLATCFNYTLVPV